jgi:ABC-type lipoprotein export system ATPase subunit
MSDGQVSIRARRLSYRHPGAARPVLDDVHLDVHSGDGVAVLGPSGSGKSTLLTLFAALRRPQQGELVVEGRRLDGARRRELLDLRASDVGLVLQQPGRNVLPYATVEQNLLFAQRPSGRTRQVMRQRAADVLEAVGLPAAGQQPAGALSGGEQQRLAVGLALAHQPRLLLADEPTSQLDRTSAGHLVALLATVANAGTTVVLVTHDSEVAAAFPRVILVRDGGLTEQQPQPRPESRERC